MSGAVSDTRAMARGREHEVLASLGIVPPPRGRHMRCPLGTHPDSNPSWRWDARAGRYHCTCGGGDILDVVQQVAGLRDVVAATSYVRDVLGLPPLGQRRAETPAERSAREARIAEARRQAAARKAQFEREDAKESARLLAFAKELWDGSLNAPGTLVETYLRSREITCKPPATLGFVEEYGKDRLPAMIAAFGLPTEPEPGELRIRPDEIAGVHLTFLLADGSGKATNADGKSKIIIGRGQSMPIVLAPPNDGLAITISEGIEDSLSWHMADGRGAWAAGTANRLPGVVDHVGEWIESVTIIEDPDPAGKRFSRRLADELIKRDIEVLIRRSAGDDANAGT